MIPKKLQALWDRKLRASGFQDIEDSKGRLKEFHSHRFGTGKQLTPAQRKAHERYYQLAGHLLHTHKFTDAVEELVWREHANGAYYSEIADKLGISTSRVQRIVESVRKFIPGRD